MERRIGAGCWSPGRCLVGEDREEAGAGTGAPLPPARLPRAAVGSPGWHLSEAHARAPGRRWYDVAMVSSAAGQETVAAYTEN